jgi:cubilin
LNSACGYNTPNPVFSNTNQLHLKAVTSRSDSYASVDITYVANNQSKGCGGQLFNYGGIFTSPMYPNTDDRTAWDCRWEVAVPQNMQVALIFNGKKFRVPNEL